MLQTIWNDVSYFFQVSDRTDTLLFKRLGIFFFALSEVGIGYSLYAGIVNTKQHRSPGVCGVCICLLPAMTLHFQTFFVVDLVKRVMT